MRVLLVSPAFHGYWAAIEAALSECGHDVTTHCYDSGGLQARLRNAAAHRLPRLQLRTAATDAAARALSRSQPDAVLVVKGDTLGSAWWDAIAHSRARSAVWLYDELERMAYTAETLRSLDSVYSYSLRDTAELRARGVEAEHLPVGYDALTPFKARPSEAVTFIGARYPGRERTLAAIAGQGIAVTAYGREWSRHPWDIARTGRWRGAGIPGHGDVPRTECYGIMAGSLATLNIHGDGHDGFSIRTFEAPGVGGLALIDRPDVARHYDVGSETLVFTSDAELLDHIGHARRDPSWAARIRSAGRKRTLAEHTVTHRMREVVRAWA